MEQPILGLVAQALGMASIRVTKSKAVDEAIEWALAQPGPVLVDALTNPEEISVPPKPGVSDAWGFAIAKTKEFVESPT